MKKWVPQIIVTVSGTEYNLFYLFFAITTLLGLLRFVFGIPISWVYIFAPFWVPIIGVVAILVRNRYLYGGDLTLRRTNTKKEIFKI
jgi:hypothetical protein